MKRLPLRLIILLIFLLTVLVCFIVSRIFSIATIQIVGAPTLIGLDSLKGKQLYLISLDDIEKEILKKNPNIQSFTLHKDYPNTLRLRVYQSKPVGALVVSDGYFLMSDSAKIVIKQREVPIKLPLITIGQKLPFNSYGVGDTLTSQELTASAYFLGKFAENGIPIETVEIRGFDVVVCKGAEHTYIFSASKNKTEQFSDFLTVYRQFFVEGKKFSSIDVRFEKPVVVFE